MRMRTISNGMKPILVSGIQPTGKLHIGNYLGALQNFVALQNSGKYQCFFFVADLHSLTESASGRNNPKEKLKQIMELLVDYIAAGLDPKKSVIFVQSAIPAHTELGWILNTLTSIGELQRMTQFKDKSEHSPENVNLGLFDYPVLMAADIILYGANFVPVGDDQLQHLEFARTLVRKFNHKFGKTFIEPMPILTDNPRVMSLDDTKKKMSKSRPAGCLFLDDSPDIIRKKIMGAVTDSGKEVSADVEGKEGIGNLVLLYSAFTNETGASIEKRYRGKGYGQFKRDLAEAAIKTLAPFQKRKGELTKKTSLIGKITLAGNKKAGVAASKKLLEVKKRIGLL